MIMNKLQQAQFEELAKPMMEFLCNNFDPHVTVIIEPTAAQISSVSMSFNTEEFVRD